MNLAWRATALGVRLGSNACLFLLPASLCCLTASAQQAASCVTTKAPTLGSAYGKLPLSFEANQGQTDPQVRFVSRGTGYSLFLTDRAAVLALTKGEPAPLPMKPKSGLNGAPAKSVEPQKSDVVRMELAGASRGIQVEGAEQLPGTANYFIGNDPAKWHTSVPTYAKVKYSGVYPGVDLVYYGNQRQLEYDFVVTSGADPKQIKLRFAGAQKLKVNADGDLEIVASNGEVAFHKPVVYQLRSVEQFSESANRRESVDGDFVLLAGNTVGFKLGNYDKNRELVIDPTLGYLTYLGGSGHAGCCGDFTRAIAVDSAGNAYVTGSTASSDFPVSSKPFQSKLGDSASNSSPANAFVTKLNAEGTAIVYSTYLGGAGDYFYRDSGQAIAVDASGHAYITGYTGSTNFPVSTGAHQTTNNAAVKNGARTAFVTKLSADGSSLSYSTYLGGSGYNSGVSEDGESGNGIALDPSGHAFVVGTTFSSDFPVTSGAYQRVNNSGKNSYRSNAFVTKLNGDGTSLDFSTYLGGSGASDQYKGSDYGRGIAVDGNGDVYVTGSTDSKDFPHTSGAYQVENKSVSTSYASGSNAFVTKFNSTGTTLIYSTYLGGTNSGNGGGINAYHGDIGYGVAVDASCHAYIAGQAASFDFPTTSGSLQAADKESTTSEASGFITKLNSAGTALDYSTYLGGSSRTGASVGDYATGIVVDGADHAYVSGVTQSTNFPVSSNAAQTALLDTTGSASGNGFVTELNSTGSAVVYSSFLGGSGNASGGDIGWAIAIDSLQNAYIAGQTYSHDLAVTPNAYQPVNKSYTAKNNESNAFVAKFSIGTGKSLLATLTSITTDANPSPVGATITFTADVQQNTACGFPPTGTVSFSLDGGTPIKVTLDDTGHAEYSISTLGVGSHSITATYSGDRNYSSSGGSLSQTVSSVSTSTILTSSPNPSSVN